MSEPSTTRPPEAKAPIIAPEGIPIVLAFFIVSDVLGVLAWFFLPLVGFAVVVGLCAVLTLWCVWFFRDPQRVIPQEADAVICPADGRVVIVDTASPPPELGLGAERMQRICIFMNVFNVHVNRSPVDGTVERIAYRPGTFLNASFDKASELNERCSLLLRLRDGRPVVCVQIAGLVARRIVCRVKEGSSLSGGQRFGLIRFGSRVDVYLPRGTVPAVAVGQVTAAGETVIARLKA
ncbi:MAG: phosphatidylserine decarboxylase [Phycisphaerae bacterium]